MRLLAVSPLPLLLLLVLSFALCAAQSEEARFVNAVFPNEVMTTKASLDPNSLDFWNVATLSPEEIIARNVRNEEAKKEMRLRRKVKFADEVGDAATIPKRPMTAAEIEQFVSLYKQYSIFVLSTNSYVNMVLSFSLCISDQEREFSLLLIFGKKSPSLAETTRQCLDAIIGRDRIMGEIYVQARGLMLRKTRVYEAFTHKLRSEISHLLATHVSMREMEALVPSFFRRSIRSDVVEWSPGLWTDSALVYSEPRNPAYISPLTIGSVLTLIFGAVLVLGIWTEFWRMNDVFKLILAIAAFAAAALLTIHALFRVMGYQIIGHDVAVLNVSQTASFLVERFANLLVLSLLAVFCSVLIESAAETMLEKESRWPRYLLGSITAVCLVYGVSMAVVSSLDTPTLVLDVTALLLVVAQFLFTGMLALTFFLIVRRFHQTAEVASFEAARNAKVFLAFSAVLFLLSSAQVVVVFAWFFRYISLTLAVMVMAYVFQFLLLSGILIYTGANLRGSWIRKRTLHAASKASKDGYVPLGNEEDDAIPPQYEA